MEFRNSKYNVFGDIDMEINHPEFGWIPFTASPNDTEEMGRNLFEEAKLGVVSPYIPPTPEEARATMPLLSSRQLRLGLVQNGFTLAQVQAVIDGMTDEVAKAQAQIEWDWANTFLRTHPLVISIGAVLGLTEEQIDTMWEAAVLL